ncbi:MAG: redox-regulated ATPase YchF [Patescibacteria group bacterium]|jgi:hypothetical protein
MSFSLGIVGLPNVGKSTLFKALTKKQIDIANYPFCTIEPNVGIVPVPDERLAQLARVSASKKIVSTVVEFVDIAGLVKGASEGEGLGNKFLANIREVDAIVQVVRGFTDPNVIHVGGKVDPAGDILTINLELGIKDLETVSRRLGELEKRIKSGLKKEEIELIKLIELIKKGLEDGQLVNQLGLTAEELATVKDLNLLTAKPMIYVMNVDESKVQSPESGVKGVDQNQVIAISAKIEAELADLNDEERKEYLAELGLAESGLDKLVKKGYEILNLITFLTAGPDESRAWTVTRGSTAPQAAGKIHTDFEKGFIRAEICNWQDFVKYGEVGCKEKGLMRIEGKDYIMQDGDTCNFRVAT